MVAGDCWKGFSQGQGPSATSRAAPSTCWEVEGVYSADGKAVTPSTVEAIAAHLKIVYRSPGRPPVGRSLDKPEDVARDAA